MPQLWYRVLLRAVARIYYRRIRVARLAQAPESEGRSVLYVALHRNGAVDGIVYKSVFPRAVFLVARQLVRTWFRRLFFTGIPVVRKGDDVDISSRRDNLRALEVAVDHLASGGELFIFPEGTSDLGPRHLPFKPGVARILALVMERGVNPLVVPLGIFYESAWAFRSDVCIVVGAPIDVTVTESGASQDLVSVLMERITKGLETIAVEAPDANALKQIEAMAAIADGEMGASRWRMQRALTRNPVPRVVDEHWRSLVQEIDAHRTAVDRAGVPRFSRRGVIWNSAWIALQLPIVAIALLANLFPLACVWCAGKRLADAPNTIALWRILIGVPCTAAWLVAIGVLAVAAHVPWVAAAYLTITTLGLVLYPELCERWPKLRNARGRGASRSDAATIAAWVRHVAA